MSYDHVIYEKKGHIAYVTLNRPERMNALDKHSHRELIEIFDDFAADANAWLAIITGAGDRAFCAGNDLKATAEASANGEERVDTRSRFAAITRGYNMPEAADRSGQRRRRGRRLRDRARMRPRDRHRHRSLCAA